MDYMSLWMPTLLPEGGVRAQTVKTIYERACKKGKLPGEVTKVLEEMRDEVAKLLQESPFERAERLELMWNEISQGNSTHAEFKVKWIAMLDDIDNELPQARDSGSLFRRYIGAIKQDLRQACMRKDCAIDVGEKKTEYRRPVTWEEAAQCCEDELKSRVDTQSAGERISAIHSGAYCGEGLQGLTASQKKRAAKKNRKEQLQPVDERRPAHTGVPAVPPGVPSKYCEYCLRTGHWKEVCPKYAADHRHNKQGIKESEAALSDYKSTGKTCSLCGWHDHYDYHHRDAGADAVYVADPANPNRTLFGKKAEAVIRSATGGGGSGGGNNGAQKPECEQGASCKWLHPKFAKGCIHFWHPSKHYREAAAKAQAEGWTPPDGKGKGDGGKGGGKGKGKGKGGGKGKGKNDGKGNDKGKGKTKGKGGRGRGKGKGADNDRCEVCSKTRREHPWVTGRGHVYCQRPRPEDGKDGAAADVTWVVRENISSQREIEDVAGLFGLVDPDERGKTGSRSDEA